MCLNPGSSAEVVVHSWNGRHYAGKQKGPGTKPIPIIVFGAENRIHNVFEIRGLYYLRCGQTFGEAQTE